MSTHKQGDLFVVYPVARRAAPVLIALGASTWPGEFLSLMAWASITNVSSSILILIFSRGKKSFSKALLPAFITALMVAAYSIIHGIGVRVSRAHLSYITWLFTPEIWLTLFVLVPRFSLLRNNGLRPFLVEFCPAYDML
ncbi:MAG: hypothetical protein CML56_08005 [Rhodobacteraceae bacterium]|nr:hypothetical protein [Paracoccaceae bacterium]